MLFFGIAFGPLIEIIFISQKKSELYIKKTSKHAITVFRYLKACHEVESDILDCSSGGRLSKWYKREISRKTKKHVTYRK